MIKTTDKLYLIAIFLASIGNVSLMLSEIQITMKLTIVCLELFLITWVSVSTITVMEAINEIWKMNKDRRNR